MCKPRTGASVSSSRNHDMTESIKAMNRSFQFPPQHTTKPYNKQSPILCPFSLSHGVQRNYARGYPTRVELSRTSPQEMLLLSNESKAHTFILVRIEVLSNHTPKILCPQRPKLSLSRLLSSMAKIGSL